MVCTADEFTGVNEQDWSRSNWSGDITFHASDYWEPDDLAQLVYVVARAAAEDGPLHAIGAGWAFEDVAATDGWMVSLCNLDRSLDYVPRRPVDAGALAP